MRAFTIEHCLPGEAAHLYTIKFEESSQSEFDLFISQEEGTVCSSAQRRRCRLCHARCKRFENLNRLAETVQYATQESGFRPELFRTLSRYPPDTGALYAGAYRLFGIRFGPNEDAPSVDGPSLFVAGNGGIKLVDKIYDDAHLKSCFKDVVYAARRLRERMTELGLDAPPLDTEGRFFLPDSLRTFPV